MNTDTFSLSRPIKTHSGEVSSLTLNEPTARAFVTHGEPFTLKTEVDANGDPQGVRFLFDKANNTAMLGFLVDMIEPKLDDLILGSMAAQDFQRLRAIAANIIVVGVQDKNPTAPSAASSQA